MKKLIFPIIVVLALALNSFFIINEAQQAIVTQFGKPVGGVRYAGIHFKIPFIQTVHTFSNRILNWDADPNQIPTSDKKYIWVDTTARWRIREPLVFFTTVATEQNARSRLNDIINSVVRDQISAHRLVDVVRSVDYTGELSITEQKFEQITDDESTSIGRNKIMDFVLEKARLNTPEYGIELIDVKIKRINYVDQVRQSVYERMISERKKVAAEYRSEGEGEKADILGQMRKELKLIESEAYQKAVQIKGEGDAKAAAIYAEAYNQDPEFYRFVRTLESYLKTIGKNNRAILSTNSEYFRLLNSAKE
ncbi:MAG: protease modulator HflC [Desulfuromonadaceae bacterium]|nr:protease modulator HflC [Desulfuromonas sp.]MDY0184647.1 protease modulator HflC [Desulfuromonadaceae bacterium]